MKILFECDGCVVCVKPVGVDSESNGKDGMPELLFQQLGKKYLTVHRLDKNVSGVMVYASSASAAAELSRQIQTGIFKKRYKALCYGEPGSGTMKDLLFHDRSRAKAFVVKRMRKGVKEAELNYSTQSSFNLGGRTVSFVDVELVTGRFHQIRAQFASRGFPLVGDGKYGARDNFPSPRLFAYMLEFNLPGNGERRRFEVPISSTQMQNLW